MSTTDDYIGAINSFVGGELPLYESDKELAIAMAMKVHSKHRPRIVVEDESGDGGFDYAISDLAAWEDNFSTIHQVEYPVDDDDETPDILDEEAWTIYEKPAGKFLRFLEDKPLATETFRVTYTALHTCTTSACTVSNNDEEAVQALAAAIFCDMIATYHAQNQDSTIAADSVEHAGQAREYAARAVKYRKLYNLHMGISEGKPRPASYNQDQDVNYPGGTDRLTHPRRNR